MLADLANLYNIARGQGNAVAAEMLRRTMLAILHQNEEDTIR